MIELKKCDCDTHSVGVILYGALTSIHMEDADFAEMWMNDLQECDVKLVPTVQKILESLKSSDDMDNIEDIVYKKDGLVYHFLAELMLSDQEGEITNWHQQMQDAMKEINQAFDCVDSASNKPETGCSICNLN